MLNSSTLMTITEVFVVSMVLSISFFEKGTPDSILISLIKISKKESTIFINRHHIVNSDCDRSTKSVESKGIDTLFVQGFS